MNKAYLHHLWTRVRPIKPWYFLIAAAICGTVCVVQLRNNYQTMTRLRTAVYTADAQNNNVEKALQNLRSYVGGHMNTSLATGDGVYPPIQLTNTYQRLQKAEQDRVAAVNDAVYPAAQHYCEALYPASFSGGPRVPCIEQYVKDHGTSAKGIPSDMYKFDFASPGWSPDLAGWTMVLGILFVALTILRLGLGYLLRALSK